MVGWRHSMGIIPAGAGRRPTACPTSPTLGDHPRGCGEKRRQAGRAPHHQGSSPRVRGEEDLIAIRGKATWIIPAGAGRSDGEGSVGADVGDHPRGCGEKLLLGFLRRLDLGSSPRVRGEAFCHAPLRVKKGIIPAGAGRRMPCPRKAGRGQDHPRGCGEKRMAARRRRAAAGSSPRVRGEGKAFLASQFNGGIIPAGAGRSRRRRDRRR